VLLKEKPSTVRTRVAGALCASARAEAGSMTPELVNECVDRRRLRQGLLPPGSKLRATFYLGAPALRCPVGGFDVMAEQLARLAAPSEADRGVIRIVPDDLLVCVGAPGSFRLLTFAGHGPVAMEELLVALVLVDHPKAIPAYAEAVERLDRIALSPEQSHTMITGLAGEFLAA